MRSVRKTIAEGLLFLAPFGIILYLLFKVLQLFRRVVGPLAEKIPFESPIGIDSPMILAFFVLLVVCFLAGLFARTRPAKAMVAWLESTLLSNIPGYSFVKSLGEEMTDANAARSNIPILARFDDAWQIGFLVEWIPEGRVAVFIPDAPSPWSGSVFIMDEERVKPLEVPSASILKSLQRLGDGTAALVKGKLP